MTLQGVKFKESHDHPVFIVFEGLDGSGKSTQSRLLYEEFRRRGKTCILTREPTDNAIGKLIRKYAREKVAWAPETEALLFTADRLEHVREIKILLNSGVNVVCDRFYQSTVAYQGAAGASTDWLLGLCELWGDVEPDITIFLDVPVDIVFQRLGQKKTIFESRDRLERAKKIYDWLSTRPRTRAHVIDGKLSQKVVHAEVIKFLEERGVL